MPVPAAPTGFTATPTPYGILLTWNAQIGLDGFFIKRGLLANHSDEAVIPVLTNYVTDGSGTGYMDLTAAPGTHYYYRLQASVNADGESTPVAADATAGLGMTVTEARDWITQFLRSGAATSDYSAADKDRGLITVCEQFARMTRCVQVAGTVALTAASAVADCSGLTTFRPERIMSAHLVTKACELQLPGFEDVHRRQIECPRSGAPERLAFETTTATSGIVYPTPDVNYNLRIKWWEPMITFTPGTVTPDAITLNIPRDYLPQILSLGVPSALQANHPSHGYAGESWKKYLAYEAAMAGAGNTGARVLVRERVR